MKRWTDRAWFTVEDAARLLRVRRNTLYDACRRGDFPCSRWGGSDGTWNIRIPAEALLLTPRVSTYSRNWHQDAIREPEQLSFDFEPPLIPVRLYRNGEPRNVGDYETGLSKKKWRNPLT